MFVLFSRAGIPRGYYLSIGSSLVSVGVSTTYAGASYVCREVLEQLMHRKELRRAALHVAASLVLVVAASKPSKPTQRPLHRYITLNPKP